MTTTPLSPVSSAADTHAGVNGHVGPAHTLAAELAQSPVVKAAIGQMVEAMRAKSAEITDVRGPRSAEATVAFEALMKQAAEVRGRPLLYPFISSGLGNGALVELADGSVKWDMITGIGVHFFGHSDPDLAAAALSAGLDDTVKHGNLLSGAAPYEFAKTLLAEAKKHSKLRHAYIATGGAMANENALKVCFQKRVLDSMRMLANEPGLKPEQLLARVTPTMRVLAFKDCFMGRSLVMAQIGDNHAGREGLPNGVHVDYMPFWDAAAAERMGPGPGGKKRFIDMAVWHLEQYINRYPGGHACFIFELCQGEGGFNVGDRDYFKALMEVCKAHKVAVWDDEIQSFGRTERMFAYEHFDLGEYVDVFCVGKMTQACVSMWTEEFNPKSGILSGTFTGEGVSFKVGQRIIERLRDGDFYGPQGRFAKHHALFRQHAKALIEKHPAWFPDCKELGGGGERLIGGLGGMMRLTPFGGNKDKVSKACKTVFEEGAVVFYCGHGPYHLRMLPPLPVFKEEDWPRVFACIERGLAKVAG